MMFSTGWKDINTTEETTARVGTNFNNQQLRAGDQARQKDRKNLQKRSNITI